MFKAASLPATEPVSPAQDAGCFSTPLVATTGNAPHHVAFIMDGNGRWARTRGLPRSAGHRQGAEALKALLEAAPKLGVKQITVYAFSAENWKRPASEIGELMHLMKLYLKRELASLKANNIRLRVIGERERLSNDVRAIIEEAEATTAANTAFDFTVCFAYGARQEITRAMRHLAGEVAAGRLAAEAISEEMIDACLYTASLPEPDLLIRTGGEKRMSNFLLWQTAYTELYFSDVLWPDFSSELFAQAIKDFSARERRYGLTGQA